MKRNLLGLWLFATILAFTAIVYQTFFSAQITDIPAVEISENFLKYPPVFDENNRSTCRIRQATLDLQTEILNVELDACNQSEFAINAQSSIALQAFIKNANDTRQVASKTFFVPLNFDGKNDRSSTTVSISADWLIESSRSAANLKDNLYLTMQNSNAKTPSSSFAFDERQAVPVLLIAGKR